MISLSSSADLMRALRSARDVVVSSFILSPGMAAALEDAVRRGAHVCVRLNGCFPDAPGLLRVNRETVRRLRALHADARLVHRSDGEGAGLHMKAAVCDRTAFLDDCNWRADGRDTIVRATGARTVRAIRDAAAYRPDASVRGMELDKRDALEAESALLRAAAGGAVNVQAESVSYSPVYSALKRLAVRGVDCRLIISKFGLHGRYLAAAQDLAQAGVDIRVAASDEKYALTGARAWLGSANATSYFNDGDQIDWGTRTSDARIVQALQAKFRANWRTSKALPQTAVQRTKPSSS